MIVQEFNYFFHILVWYNKTMLYAHIAYIFLTDLSFSIDAAQQTCDGASRWRLGDLWELPAEAWPLPYAADFQSGRQSVTHLHEVP